MFEMRLLCLNDEYEKLAFLYDYMKGKGVEIVHAKSGRFGLERFGFQPVDGVLVADKLTDMTGLEFVELFVKKYPMINSIMLSSMDPEEFHESTEGLGVLMQLSEPPTFAEVDEMIEKLDRIRLMLLGLQGAAA